MNHSSTDARPGLAMIANVLTPYRIHLHKLVAEGIPELRLHTLVTHGPADFDWKLRPPETIHPSFFGSPDDSPLAGTFRRPLTEWRKGGRLIDYLQQNDIRAVIMMGHRYISYLRTIRYCHAVGLPLFVNNDSNIHGDRHLSAGKRWAKRRFYSWWLRRTSGIMSMGEYGDQFFIYYGADPARLYHVPYWPDFDAFANVDDERLHQFRRKFRLSANRKHILFSGRLVPVKRVDLLIDVFISIADQRPEWDLLIAGDGVLRRDLQQRVPSWLQPRVKWTGFLDGGEPALAYHAADVLALPSDREPWALVVQEAMSAGLAVVASDVTGAAHELVENGVSGMKFRTRDKASLENALLAVTAAHTLEGLQQRSREALNQWRSRIDPVAEIRRALRDVDVLDRP
ncbi:MAG TPA: glycosyltransferase family 4 protein [Lacipirellulaceae bacterium]|nr:glycosyltransferase family 4 protein [Lacipirellulaceae bacterium]